MNKQTFYLFNAKLVITGFLVLGIACFLTMFLHVTHRELGHLQSPAIPLEPEEEQQESADNSVEGFGSTPRSPKWTMVRNAHLDKYPECAACGSTEDLNVHHIQPFHQFPELELEPSNLITLCRPHHFNLGHRRNWKDWNPYVKEDAALLRKQKYERNTLGPR